MDYPKSNPKVGLYNGKFTDGSADGTVKPSLDTADWANAVTDEILSVIVAGGLVPAEATRNQMATSIVNIASGALPARIKSTCELISDWNTATKSGWYGSSPATINGPTANAYGIGRVDAYNSDWIVQTVRLFMVSGSGDTATYQRQYSTSTNGWSAWYRIRQSEDEIFATDAEASALIVTKKAVSPKQISSLFATDAEAAALTSANKAISPLQVGNLFGRSLAAAGYQKLPGGLILQWGNCIDDNVARSFPIAFPVACTSIVATSNAVSGTANIMAVSNTQYRVMEGGGANGSAITMYWIALGY